MNPLPAPPSGADTPSRDLAGGRADLGRNNSSLAYPEPFVKQILGAALWSAGACSRFHSQELAAARGLWESLARVVSESYGLLFRAAELQPESKRKRRKHSFLTPYQVRRCGPWRLQFLRG